jgi:glutathione S-transferase
MLPVTKKMIIYALKLGPKQAEEALKKTKTIMAEFDMMLNDGRKYILKTDEPTYVDFALAALIGSFYLHPKYGGR